jgi:Transposase IS200 like
MCDRRRYLHWVFEAQKRFGLAVLNYMITSNHVHLLIKDTGPNVIADSIQLIAGRTAQEAIKGTGYFPAECLMRHTLTNLPTNELPLRPGQSVVARVDAAILFQVSGRTNALKSLLGSTRSRL